MKMRPISDMIVEMNQYFPTCIWNKMFDSVLPKKSTRLAMYSTTVFHTLLNCYPGHILNHYSLNVFTKLNYQRFRWEETIAKIKV